MHAGCWTLSIAEMQFDVFEYAPFNSNLAMKSSLADSMSNLWRSRSAPAMGSSEGAVLPTESATLGATETPSATRRSDETIVIDVESGRAIGPVEDVAGPADVPNVVHQAIKSADVWFGYEVSGLENEARELARIHAEKGQPRHDLERTRPLEMEVILEQRGKEILWGWITRVQRKMLSAIGGETEKIGAGLASAREAVANAGGARDTLDRERRVALVPGVQIFPHTKPTSVPEGSSQSSPEPVVECERHIAPIGFWILMVLLVFADFVANAPLFTELFPANRAIDEALSGWEEQALSEGALGLFGVKHVLMKLSAYPEATLLALSVVVFFVFLGHVLGTKTRTLVALRKHRHASPSVSDAFRQAIPPVVLSAIGIVCTLVVLFFARSYVEPMAQGRYDHAESALTTAQQAYQGALENPDNLSAIQRARIEMGRLEGEVAYRTARLDYARSIEAMNGPILGLNIVLVIAAVIAGYLHHRKRFPLFASAAEPESVRRRTELLRADFITRREAAHEAMRSVGTAIHRVEQLLDADPLRDWYGKSERIRNAIPLFRMENARLRGLDKDDILAFRAPINLNLPTPEQAGITLERPVVLDLYKAEFEKLQGQLHTLDTEGFERPAASPALA